MKQRVDHSNYEAWLLDRLEGNLSAEQEAELAAFLLMHPHLDPGTEELPAIDEVAARLSALDKESLKRRLPPVAKVDANSIDDHLIARLENDLTAEQLAALRAYLAQHPEHQRAERIYALTKLVPEAMAFAAKHGTLHRALPPTGMPARHTLDDFLVARLEGELGEEQEAALDLFITSDDEARRAWSLMQATRVLASDIVFKDKASLKQGGRVIAITRASWAVRLAAAASVLVVLGTAWWWWQRTDHGEQMAEEERRTLPAQERDITQQPVVSDLAPMPLDSVGDAPERQEFRIAPVGKENQGGRPEPAPLPQEETRPMAEDQPGERPVDSQEQHAPVIEPLQVRPEEPLLAHTQPAAAKEETATNTVGQALAATLRERVLDVAPDPARPLGEQDAFAAVDRGLKAIGGQRTGFEVARDGKGRNRGFNLRLGRNLAISASR